MPKSPLNPYQRRNRKRTENQNTLSCACFDCPTLARIAFSGLETILNMASDRDLLITRISRSLRSDLPSSSVVVKRPDHPLLFAGPDILAGSNGQLVAAFVPKARELTSWKLLQSRLIANRLALPVHTKCILVCDDAASLLGNLPDGAFDEVYSPQEVRKTAMVMAGNRLAMTRSPRLLRSRQQAMVNYGAILHIQRIQTSRWEAAGGTLNRDSISQEQAARFPVMFGESYIGRIDRSSPVVSLQTFARRSFFQNYQLIDGVPELKRDALDVAIKERDLRPGLDPGKPMRASAFAGWLLTESALTGDLEEYMMSSINEFERTRQRLWAVQRRGDRQ